MLTRCNRGFPITIWGRDGMADMEDSKSSASDSVWVRPPSPLPLELIVRIKYSNVFYLCLYYIDLKVIKS